jgi:hypothetical protein
LDRGEVWIWRGEERRGEVWILFNFIDSGSGSGAEYGFWSIQIQNHDFYYQKLKNLQLTYLILLLTISGHFYEVSM